MNSDLPEGSAGPGAEEDAESARDAGAAERYEAQAGTEGAEGPGKAPPQAGGSVPTETGAPAESASPKRSAAPGAATGSAGPGAEEDAESARDAGAAERYAAQAGTEGTEGAEGAEGTEGPGRAPPQAGGNRPAEATV